MSEHDFVSLVQKELEPLVLSEACKNLGLGKLETHNMDVGNGQRAEVRGRFEGTERVYMEANVSLGIPTGAQKHKLKADALKLIFVSQISPGRKILVVTSKEVATWLSHGWFGAALKEFQVEVHSATLPNDQRAHLEEAWRRQGRTGVSNS